MINRASDIGGMDRLSDALNNFRCYKDEDIETFLREKAQDYLQRGWCAIYLILDEDAFNAGNIKIDAYFTLSHKSLIAEEFSGISKSRIKNVSGFRKDAKSINFVLVGQLGKHIEKVADGQDRQADVTSREILDFAFEVVRASSELIPCRCVLVECSDNPKVQKVYTDYDFSLFQYDGEHYQFYKRI